MGTVINTNVSALNSLRSLKVVGEKTGKASEKLSSGLRINRAGDDAAGLAISEKMRSQIKGLNQASRNSQDGISLIQTAEGALQESHDMLQRMRELAVQAGNGTNKKDDREKIALELNELSDELTSISDKTEFNKKKLINGDLSQTQITLQTGANDGQTMSFSIAKMDANVLGVGKDEIGAVVASGGGKIDGTTVVGQTIGTGGLLAAGENHDLGNGQSVSKDNKGGYTITGFGDKDGSYTSDEFKSKFVDAAVITAQSGATVTIAAGGASITTAGATGSAVTAKDVLSGDITAAAPNSSKTSTMLGTPGAKITGYTDKNGALSEISFSGVERSQIGGTGISDELVDKISSGEKITLAELENIVIASKDGSSTTTFNADGKGVYMGGAKTVNVSGRSPDPSAEAMGSVIKKVDQAIATVSEQRAKLGAYQNRLEHTIKNLDTSSENLSAAESRIRDTDLAKEMIEFTKSNVLSQAAQSMLAQANQAPNSALQLLG